MKSNVRVLVLLWSLAVLAGCGLGHDPVAEQEEPAQAKQVVAALDEFL